MKPFATSKMELFGTKTVNDRKLLLAVVTQSFVAGLLDPTLKCIYKLRLGQ